MGFAVPSKTVSLLYEREPISPLNLGAASLLVSFAVLCLTVFALLSLATVRADDRLGEASSRATADYYAADLEAQAILAGLRQGRFPEDVEVMSAEYAGWPGGRGWSEYSYAVPVADTRELQVEVRIDTPDDYKVLRYQVVNTGQWSADDTLDLWDGEPF